MRFIDRQQIDSVMNWPLAISVLREGHQGARPLLQEMALDSGPGHLLSKAVHLPGTGIGVKVAAIFPPNLRATPPKPAEDALFIVFREQDWQTDFLVAGPPVTRWKTAADSALASSILSRPDSRQLLCIGAGPIAEALVEAHVAVRPTLTRIEIWNRTPARGLALCEKLAEKGIEAVAAANLESAVAAADIITSATASPEPVVSGAHVRPGTHVDLVGAYSTQMRESDDELIAKSSIYVDCYAVLKCLPPTKADTKVSVPEACPQSSSPGSRALSVGLPSPQAIYSTIFQLPSACLQAWP